MKFKLLPFIITITLLGCQSKNPEIWTPDILTEFIQNPKEGILPDFSYAGYQYGEIQPAPMPDTRTYLVVDYGAIPNDDMDDTESIQKAIDIAGQSGGGIIEFPKGKFLVNMDSTKAGNILINYSNIVLRGSGSDSLGTIIYSGNSMHQHQKTSPYLSQFIFHTGVNLHGTDSFYTVDVEPLYSFLQEDVKKGEDILQLEKTEGLATGMHIILAMRNTTPDGDLIKELMAPLAFEPFQTSYLESGKNNAPSFQWFVEIKKVIDDTRIQIKQPVKRDIKTGFKAFVSIVPMLQNIGIENFRFECAYKGGYKHHLNAEHDYGWGAVCLHRVAHGWIKDVTIHNYTQTTHLVNSRNISINNITITGFDGHYGPKIYSSSDNLISDINVLAPRTHGPGLEGASFGNVFKDIHLEYTQPLDLHGMAGSQLCPPMYNLYENISNTESIAGGGAPLNIPHAGEYNTFWNIEMTGFKDSTYNEVFYSWIWRNPERFQNEMHIDCHKQYLRSIVVGVSHPEENKLLSIEHSELDRNDEWIYVEGLNKKRKAVSLYDTQLKLRLETKSKEKDY